MRFHAAREFVECAGQRLLDDPCAGLVSLSVGTREQGPVDDDTEFCVRLGVEKKLTRTELRRADLLPHDVVLKRHGLPFDPIDVDVVERGPLHAAGALTPGAGIVSGAPPRSAAKRPEGSVGFFVDTEDGALHLVSCNHVLTQFGQGRVGDPIFHPAPSPTATAALPPALPRGRAVATLSAALPVELETTSRQPSPENVADVATARIANPPALPHLLALGATGLRLVTDFVRAPGGFGSRALLNRRVAKVGAATGTTWGFVSDLYVRTRLHWGTASALFVDQMFVQPLSGPSFAACGDSGSALVTDTGELIGLVFAVAENGGALVNRADLLLDALRRLPALRGLRVVTETSPPRSSPLTRALGGP